VILLLDTCALIWFFAGSGRINDRLQELLTDPTNEVKMSDISVLELVIKYQLGKLDWQQSPSRLLPVLARKHRLTTAPLTQEAIYYLEQLPLLHRDPFDRLLVAQAVTSGCALVTCDPLICQYPVQTIW
jgi:PIN domain nuclease of toxin-antitoxin system